MARTILVLGVIAGLVLTAVGWPTYIGPDKEPRTWLMLTHLGASLLALLTQLWLIFDFVGTGIAVRRFAGAVGGEASAWTGRSRLFRRRVLPWAVTAAVMVVALFVAAGAEASRFVPGAVHKGVYGATVVLFFLALWKEWGVCKDNEGLLAELDRAERAAAA